MLGTPKERLRVLREAFFWDYYMFKSRGFYNRGIVTLAATDRSISLCPSFHLFSVLRVDGLFAR
jgi:hypothetical protein